MADGYHLWSDRYDRELDDVFAIQDEIAAAIAERLRITLGAGAEERRVKPPTGNLEAYELYLKGRAFWNQRGGGLRPALECFQKALSLDPEYALAHVGVAEAYSLLCFYGMARPREVMPKAKSAAERAFELDENLAEARGVLAFISFIYDWDWQTAESGFRRAIEAKPTNPTVHYWYALSLSWVEGRADEAVAEARRAVEVDPLGAPSNAMLALALYCAHRYEEAITQSRKTIELDPSFMPRCFGRRCRGQERGLPSVVGGFELRSGHSGRRGLKSFRMEPAWPPTIRVAPRITLTHHYISHWKQYAVRWSCKSRR